MERSRLGPERAMTPARLLAVGLLTGGLLAAAACGGTATKGAAGPGIGITGMTFQPLDLQVMPGTVVTVWNYDGMPHSVTSQATAGAFTPGASAGVSFDTGPITAQATLTIPSTVPVGTVFHYYCSTHLGAMATPNGTITVVATAPPGTGTPYPGSP
jgi:plastocyanin